MSLSAVAALLLTIQGPTPAEAAMLSCAGKPDEARLACLDAALAAAQASNPEAATYQASAPTESAEGPAATDAADTSTADEVAAPVQALPAPEGTAATSAMPMSGPERLVPDDPAPVAEARPSDERLEEPDSRFGLREEKEDEPKSMTANVTGVTFSPYGKAIVTLADGQVWRQLDSDGTTIRDRVAERAETATVKRGLFGSHTMKIEPGGRAFKVRRER